LGALLAGGSLRAELVWSPGTGWRIDGGVLSGLIGDDARKATELMNKARLSEERRDLGSAAKAYENVGKRYGNSVFAPEAYYRAARMRFERQQYFKAYENFQQVLTRYPSYGCFIEIVGE